MNKDMLTMSKKELTRLEVMQKLEIKRMNQKEAGKLLGITDRQVRRLFVRYKKAGAKGLISKRRDRAGNNQMDRQVKQKVIGLLHSQYADFGPTLASEKLGERDGLKVSRESVRQIMIAEELWKPRKRKAVQVHQMRPRRACVGELIQIDGSPHNWFEERGPRCNVLVFVDDASGRLMELYFTPEETTQSYFAAIGNYFTHYGLPKAFYSDKNSIFRVNHKGAVTGSGMTQFGRAMHQFDIEVICANSPQAKGRVERMNLTLQDRLVKELRLNNICDIESANAFSSLFLADFNRRFAVQPRSEFDMHRPVTFSKQELELIFSHQEIRTLSKNLTLQFNHVIYQIQTARPTYALSKAQVTVCQFADGNISILYKGKPLSFSVFHKQAPQADVVQSKHINAHLDKQPHRPASNHPWRNYGQNLNPKSSP